MPQSKLNLLELNVVYETSTKYFVVGGVQRNNASADAASFDKKTGAQGLQVLQHTKQQFSRIITFEHFVEPHAVAVSVRKVVVTRCADQEAAKFEIELLKVKHAG